MPAGTWTVKTNLPSYRAQGGGAGLGPNTGYFYYGWGSGGIDSACYEYNTVGDWWTQKADGTRPRYKIPSFPIGDDKAYAGPGEESPYNDMSEYSKASDVWVVKASIASGRERYLDDGASLGLYGYMANGYSPYGGRRNYMDEYSQAGDSWTAKTNCSLDKYSNGMCSVSDDLILSAYGIDSGFLKTAEVYSQSGDSWSVVLDGPSPARSDITAQALTANDTRGYFFGGYDSSAKDDCDEYNPNTQSWASQTNMPGVNNNHMSAQVGNAAYCVGGAAGGTACWEFAMPEVPVVTNLSPAHEQTDVPVDSNVQFDITHPDGIDPDTIDVSINGVDVIIDGVFQAGYSGSITEI